MRTQTRKTTQGGRYEIHVNILPQLHIRRGLFFTIIYGPVIKFL